MYEKYFSPTSVAAAVKLKTQFKDKALLVAGGTASVQLVSKGFIEPEAIISLDRLPLNYVRKRGKGLEIGATTTAAALVMEKGLPDCLIQAAQGIHGLALKETATVGGNIFTPAPGGDMAVALLSLGAELVLRGKNGTRTVPLSKFYRGPLKFNIRNDEILTAVVVRNPPRFSAFVKHTPWRYTGPSLASVSVALDADEVVQRINVAVGGLTPHPYLATKVEKSLKGQKLTKETVDRSAPLLTDEVEISETGFASKQYLRHLAQVLYKRILNSYLEKHRGG